MYESESENNISLLFSPRNWNATEQANHWLRLPVRHLVTYDRDPGDGNAAALAKSSDDQTSHCQTYMESKFLLQLLTKEEVKIVEQYEWTWKFMI